jgi:formate dehydrogenase subunit gamma
MRRSTLGLRWAGLCWAFPLLVLLGLMIGPSAARATEEPNNQPNHSEQELLQRLNQTAVPPGTVSGFVHIPDQKAEVLVQPAGRTFQAFHVGPRRWIEGGLILLALAAMAGLYFFAGVMTYKKDPQGRTMQRFTAAERFVHWMTAVSFCVLALTGLNLVFGRVLLQPLIGDAAFYQLTVWGKLAHNFFGFPFIFGLALMALQWLRENLPSREDITWVKMAGGMFGGGHPPAGKFNAGQKMIYWFAVLGGGLICLTGLALLFPFYVTGINGMQVLQVVHSLMAGVMTAIIIAHIYLGAIGVEGSFSGMAVGRVDVNWARTHHRLWLEQEAAKGKVPPDGATGLHPAE